MSYAFLAASILIGVFGQIGLKYSTTVTPRYWLISKQFNEYLLLSMAIYFCSLILYVLALRKVPLSVAFPSVSFSYVAVSYLSHVIWGTPFGLREIAALILISSGIAILVMGSTIS